AARGGGLKSERLEPPFVGRERELRLVKELFHASAEERKAHLVSIVGIAGIGKSRLVWELYKYLDGLAEHVLWHRGRCLAYGDGVTYSALTEMIRGRAGIAEGEAAEPARAKLDAMLELYVADEEERGWVAPRLAQLLALEERQAPDQADLFAGSRLFLERLAERNPVVLVFEDMQWADAALLDFVDYALEWSRNHPIFVLALARPEIAARTPASGWRNSTTLPLAPLAPAAMEALVDGFVPGLPDDLRAQILGQAEGVPLYAVETVRMLLDRGLLERHGEEYRTAGPIGSLAVPETLHALVAARLDSLEPEERRLLQDAAVVGKTFTKDALAAVSELPAEALETILVRLIRKEVLSLDQDPRSPERGQYGFLQDLLRQVAFETLARREQKSRHLRVAAHLSRHASGDELAEVVAAHYVAAYDAEPDAGDAVEIRAQAKAMLARAGERAASLAAAGEAQRYFERALELADAPLEQAELQERAGRMALLAARVVEARAHFERAIETLESMGLTHPAARVSAALAELEWAHENRIEEAILGMERALAVLADEERDGDVATLAAQLGKLLFFAGRNEDAFPQLELALEIAESLRLADVLSQALNTKGLILHARGRRQEATVLVRHALEVALANDLAGAAQRAYNNLSYFAGVEDRTSEMLELGRAALELARRVGDRRSELHFRVEHVTDLVLTGSWDEAFIEAEELSRDEAAGLDELGIAIRSRLILPLVHTGRVAEARDAFASQKWRAGDAQSHAIQGGVESLVLLGEQRFAEALATAEGVLARRPARGSVHPAVRLALIVALDAAFALGNEVKVDELLEPIESLPPGELTRSLRAIGAHFGARRAALRGDAATTGAGFAAAADLFREIALPFEL
ncbi:MAG: AAA family ATPase, partial [Gaiellaceae bacterium]